MSRTILGREISRVKIIDDDRNSRGAMVFTITDADFLALPDDGPLPELAEFVENAKQSVDAVICDHRLSGTYAKFNGAEAAACLYKEKCPAVLCTRWNNADIDAMRQYIRFIPSLLSTDNVDPETIAAGIARCIQEFNDDPPPSRKPWRTLIAVESVAGELLPALFYVTIPGWDSKEIVRLQLDLIPEEQRLRIQPGFRFFAAVNKGAERPEELYFSNFEFPKKG
jgi:hypothetical protein